MSTVEQWRAIPGWEGFYEVSDLGRIKSLERWVPRKGQAPQIVREKIMIPNRQGSGHWRVTLRKPGEPKVREYVHRLVALVFIGPCPPGLEVCHGPGGQDDNSVSNLRYDTHGENMKDIGRHGRWRNQFGQGPNIA